MKDQQIPKNIYILQVFNKDKDIYVNAWTRANNSGCYQDETSTKRAMRHFLGNGKPCRIIKVPVTKTEITNYDPASVLSRKYQRYYKSEISYIEKFSPNFENSLYKVNFIKLNDIKLDNDQPYYKELLHLIDEAKNLHINYGMVVQIKHVSGLESDKVYFAPLANESIHDMFDDKIYYFWEKDFSTWYINKKYSNQIVELARKIGYLDGKLAYNVDFLEKHPSQEVNDAFISNNKLNFVKESE